MMQDKTKKQNGDSREPSEFGSGVVVCLAKFSEHLWNSMTVQFIDAARWAKMSEDDRRKEQAESTRHPYGDASKREMNRKSVFALASSEENQISMAIELWANEASDHFSELDRDRSPQSLIELADLTLQIGHSFSEKLWTMKDWEKIRDLWRQACLAVDEQIGCRPDWGQW